MVNMNKHKDPCIYGLTSDAGVFYVGTTKTNAQNRLWEHIYRARSGHIAPVYQRMREIGLDNIGFTILRNLEPDDDALAIEASIIFDLLASGVDLSNQKARDGVPESMSAKSKALIGVANGGKPTWIKGLTGERAGWTDARRKEQSMARSGQFKHGSRRLALEGGCPCPACERWREDNPGSGMGRGYKHNAVQDMHGTAASYKHGKCRCEDCRTAYRVYQRRFAKKKITVVE